MDRDGLYLFTEHLHLLLRSGIPITKALEALGESDDPALRSVCRQLQNSIFKGMGFSKAMSTLPESFPQSYCRIVHTGELSGQLVQCLERLSSTLEHDQRMSRLVKSALIYPAALLASSSAMIVLVLYFVFPMLLKVTSDAGIQPPALTQFLITLSSPVTLSWVVLILLTAGGALYLLLKNPQTGPHLRHFWESYTPPGRFLARTQAILSVRQLALMLDSGVDLVRALGLAAKVGQKSILVRVAFEDVSRMVSEGEKLSDGFARHPVFPKSLAGMVSVAEESGGISAILYRLGDVLEEELQSKIKVTSAALEPILMGAVGIVVGTVILGAFLPVYNLIAL